VTVAEQGTESFGGRRSAAWAGLAGALLAGTVLLIYLHQRTGTSELTAAALVEPLARRAAAVGGGPWTGRPLRGEPRPAEWSFKLGVSLVDLRLALLRGDAAEAGGMLRQILAVLDRGDLAVAPDVKQAYRGMEDSLRRGAAPRSLLDRAEEREAQGLGGSIEPFLLDLGRWVEAARRSALAHRPEIFTSRTARRLLDRALAPGADQVDQEVQAAVRALRASAGGDAARLDYPRLDGLCRGILEHFFP
jgi:hypothetical protein